MKIQKILYVVILISCSIAIILSLIDKNWTALIWAFNCALWVGIAWINLSTCKKNGKIKN